MTVRRLSPCILPYYAPAPRRAALASRRFQRGLLVRLRDADGVDLIDFSTFQSQYTGSHPSL